MFKVTGLSPVGLFRVSEEEWN